MLILDSNRYSRDPAEVSGEFSKFVEKRGGEMLVSRLWEERRLAYPIDGHRKGTYWLTYFKIDSSQIKPLERDCQLSENIIRSLVLKIDPRIADTLVAHARADQKPATSKSPGTVDSEGKSEEAESADSAEATEVSPEDTGDAASPGSSDSGEEQPAGQAAD